MAEAITIEAVTLDYQVYGDDLHPSQFLDAILAIARREFGPDGEGGFMRFFFG